MKLVAALCFVAGCSSSDGTSTKTATLQMDPFTVEAGQEVWKCQEFANPFGGDAQVVTWRSHLSDGSHHLLVSQIAGASDTAVTDCGSSNLDGEVFDAQSPESETAYPDGVAFTVDAGTGFRVEAHYLNASDAALVGSVTIEADYQRGTTALTPAGPMLYTTTDISIPPGGAPVTVSYTCNVDHDLYLIDTVSHMHRHGIEFTAATADTMLYQTDNYSHPPRHRYDPPLALVAGTPVTFSCTYVNTGSTTITFGQSAATDEMCALFGTYYPVADGADPFMTCFGGARPPP